MVMEPSAYIHTQLLRLASPPAYGLVLCKQSISHSGLGNIYNIIIYLHRSDWSGMLSHTSCPCAVGRQEVGDSMPDEEVAGVV